jgi:hypothetical protein
VRDERLRRLADDAECRGDWFLGSALADYQIRRGLSDDGLAAELGIDLDALDLLRLCRWPASRGDYEAVAGRFGLSVEVLRRMVGEMGEAPPSRSG